MEYHLEKEVDSGTLVMDTLNFKGVVREVTGIVRVDGSDV